MQHLTVPSDQWSTLLALRQGGRGIVTGAIGDVYAPLARREAPMVLAQVGQSLDGRVATVDGDARDISGAAGLAHLHRLRALSDAVIVGAGTVIADNPRLSVRHVTGPDPVRVVIDCHGQVPDDAGLFHDGGARVIVVTCALSTRIYPPSVEVTRIKQGPDGICTGAILAELGRRGLRTVLVEGGARTIARFLQAGYLHRLHVTVAPLIIGAGPTGLILPPVPTLDQAYHPRMKVYDLGGDILFDCVLPAKTLDGVRDGKDIEMPD